MVQLKSILSEVMSMSNQEEMSESGSENDAQLGNQEEIKEGEVKVRPYIPPKVHILMENYRNKQKLTYEMFSKNGVKPVTE